MKNVQISEELFIAIMRYFMLEQVELLPQIKQGLEKKLGHEFLENMDSYGTKLLKEHQIHP